MTQHPKDPSSRRELEARVRYYLDTTWYYLGKYEAEEAAFHARRLAHFGGLLMQRKDIQEELKQEHKAQEAVAEINRLYAEEQEELLKKQVEQQAFEAVQNRLTQEVPDNANTNIDLSPRDGGVLAGDVHGDAGAVAASHDLPVDTR